MTQLEEIIKDLTDSSKTLTDPLLKTKVIARRMDNPELLQWVNNELEGYRQKDDKDIPAYRSHGKQTFYYGYQRNGNNYTDQQVPLSLMDEEFRKKIIYREFKESIKLLEEQASAKHGEYLVQEFSIDFCATLTAQFRKAMPGIQVFAFKIMLHTSEIIQVLAEIRSKLLGFILEIESAFPNLEDLVKEQLTVKNQEFQQQITNIFHTQIYARDNNTIVHGSDNRIDR